MKDFKKFSKKKNGSKKDHKKLNQKINIILVFFGICTTMASYCQDETTIKASVSGMLNCTNTLVTIQCNAGVKGTIYKWTANNKNEEWIASFTHMQIFRKKKKGVTNRHNLVPLDWAYQIHR